MDEKKTQDESIFGWIYKITNLVNGKIYVGQTAVGVQERFKQHTITNSYIGRALRLYGVENFELTTIDTAENAKALTLAEIKHIHSNNSLVPNGYNIRIPHHMSTTRFHPKYRFRFQKCKTPQELQTLTKDLDFSHLRKCSNFDFHSELAKLVEIYG